MKTETKSKTGERTRARTKVKGKALRMIRASPSPSTASNPSLSAPHVPSVKTCEEVQVGDIGGFGSTEELESHENRCN